MFRSRIHWGMSAVVALLCSCQHVPRVVTERAPSSRPEAELLVRLYELKNRDQLLWDRLQLAKKKLGFVDGKQAPAALRLLKGDVRNEITEVEKARSALAPQLKKAESEAAVLFQSDNSDSPRSFPISFDRDWRAAAETWTLHKLAPYEIQPRRPLKIFAVTQQGALKTELTLRHYAFSWLEGTGKRDKNVYRDQEPRYLEARLRCDSPVRVKTMMFIHDLAVGEEELFQWYDATWNGQRPRIEFGPDFKGCELRFRDASYVDGPQYGVRFQPEHAVAPALALRDDKVDVCRLPKADRLDGPEKFFMTSRYLSMTCPDEVAHVKTLAPPEDSLLAKAEALLGQPLPAGFMKNGNPFAPLDMSKAPKLDLILISTLVFRHDFHGHVLARLLRWHAARGTPVRILAASAIALDKDTELFYDLMADYSNVKVHEYQYVSQGLGFRDWLDKFHRVNHVKLFMTLSSDPQGNVVIMGGRNVHDGFAFETAPDLSRWPALVQYGEGKDETFAHWRDFEVEIRDRAFVEKIASHWLTLWTMDSNSLFMRSFNMNVGSPVSMDPAKFAQVGASHWIRHVVSVPYKDEMAMESFYADIFESARSEILLSTPYFHPTKKLQEALTRAVKRGVKVKLVTRLDLKGDTADIILGEVNKTGVNDFLNKIKIYEYTTNGVILHSKLILIDGKMTYVTSVNMNQRSFYHDLENGLLIYGPEFNRRIAAIMDGYFAQSREITEKQKLVFWKQLVIKAFEKEL